ncbi:alanine racemase [Gulosibacter faecalis]|jgi:D-serine deaminase-like pyridoxal phosphate-dependent protein|uniref:Alanine racemase n=2 Tax=Gulosibacter faecalis TaxID=272240 RepID=A0ABW5UUV0_9MICO
MRRAQLSMPEPLRRAGAELAAPCAIIDLDEFDKNIAAIARRAAGTPVRVASKSLRTNAAIERVLEHPGFHGVLAFTLPEAIMLVGRGHRDVVLGYPVTDAPALRELRADALLRRSITLMVDSVDQLDYIETVAPGRGHLRVAIEVDASWRPAERLTHGAVHVGVRRSTVRTPEQAAVLARSIRARPRFKLVGLMAYEAQVAGLADGDLTVHGAATRMMRRRSIVEIAARRAAVVEAVRAEVGELEFVNGGGTGSIESTVAEASVTEVAVGSGLFAPVTFDRYVAFRHRASAYFGLDVVRKPADDIATLHGGGWVASGVPGDDRLPTIEWPEGLQFTALEAAGEVQSPVHGPAARGLQVGDRVWLRHAKAGELAERVSEFAVITSGRIDTFWPTYRGEGLAFL